MKTIKMGVFGLSRGSSFFNNILYNNGEVVALCDKNEKRLREAAEKLGGDVRTYTDFDEFINDPELEAVFLCNFFHEHAPYAIKALEKNIHVLSECTSNSTMKDGVALVRAAEKSNAIYMLAENYPFMTFNTEMKKIYDSGKIGRAVYAEGEYNHPMDPADHASIRLYRPYEKHWRNFTPRTYYITHSLAPLMHITGAFPKRVTAMPVHAPFYRDGLMSEALGDKAAIVTCLNNDGSVFRVTGCAAFGAHGNCYRICGSKGQVENLRGEEKIHLMYNAWDKPEGEEVKSLYTPVLNDKDSELIQKAGHGGGDFIVIREFFESIRENKPSPFDVYFATTIASVAILAHRSLLEGGTPYDIPDFRLEDVRREWENDTETPFWGTDGTAPTVRVDSNPDLVPNEEWIEDYRKIIADIQ